MTLALFGMTKMTAAHYSTRPRSLWAIAGLNVITLGLYSTYWWYVANRDLRDLGRSRNVAELDVEPALSALAYFVGGCLIVPQVWTAVTTSERIRLAQNVVGAPRNLKVGLSVMLILAALAVGFVPASSAGAVVAVLAAGVLLRTVAIAYLQSSLNRVWERESASPAPQPDAVGDVAAAPMARV
jgi:Domain of unknown function (DUF4234)